jgi:hypothetical protein
MAFPDDVWPAEDLCEVCGIRLGDEVVIQEFADGSLARLCPECAAGAALDNNPESASNNTVNEAPTSIWPEEPVEETSAVRSTESDPLEKTRELLMPVTDLITLQGEMQNALERLAGSLERFAAEVLTESQDKPPSKAASRCWNANWSRPAPGWRKLNSCWLELPQIPRPVKTWARPPV